VTARHRVCATAELVAGEARYVALAGWREGDPPRRAIVLRDRHGAARAYLDLCLHLPVPLSIGPDGPLDTDRTHLLCRTHGARYRPEDGLCIEGPCEGESLQALELIDEGGVIFVTDPGK